MNSILGSVKKMLGPSGDYEYFDPELIMHINSVFTILHQLGVGPEKGFSIKDESDTWDEYITSKQNLEAVKTYVYLKVRLIFDPPQSSIVAEAIKQQISELEWRLNVDADYK